MKDLVSFVKVWIWFVIFCLVESATLFTEPIELWWVVLIANFGLSMFMVYTKDINC